MNLYLHSVEDICIVAHETTRAYSQVCGSLPVTLNANWPELLPIQRDAMRRVVTEVYHQPFASPESIVGLEADDVSKNIARLLIAVVRTMMSCRRHTSAKEEETAPF